MICTVEWNNFSPGEWEKRFAKLKRSNLLQSAAYARAQDRLHRQKARQGLIHIDGKEAGLVQVLEAGVWNNMLHAVILDRGPLWFEGFGSAEHIGAFFRAFNKEFPRRLGRRRRIMPEAAHETEILDMFRNNGLCPNLRIRPYQTCWLGLAKDIETVHMNLKKNWRNSLSKAERSGLEIEWDESGKSLSWLLKIYALDKAQREYGGPSPRYLSVLAEECRKEENLLIARATLDARPIAAILILCHGQGATYQAGWTSEEGRKCAAHHLLLWDALGFLKERGIRDLDLGGVNDESAAGVKIFKEGMGGELAVLAGLYS